VVLGNIGTTEDLPDLQQAAAREDSLIREHAQWAIARIQERGNLPLATDPNKTTAKSCSIF